MGEALILGCSVCVALITFTACSNVVVARVDRNLGYVAHFTGNDFDIDKAVKTEDAL